MSIGTIAIAFRKAKGHMTDAQFDIDKFILLAKSGPKPIAANKASRIGALRARHRAVAAAGNVANEIAVLQEWAGLTAQPTVLRLLASALVRNGERHLAIPLVRAYQSHLRSEPLSERKELLATITWQSVHDRDYLQETAKSAALANAVEVQSNPELLSRLEEMISARIGAAVRHIRSEALLRARQVAGRTIVYRRAYTKHWFDVCGSLARKLPVHIGDDGTLGVFVKSAVDLPTRPDLEFMVSEHRGHGLRTPYFLGRFSISDLQVAAWESIDMAPRSFQKLPVADQTRVVEAIATLNALNAAGIVPDETKWVGVKPDWFKRRFLALRSGGEEWERLYASTVEALKHQEALAADIRADGETFLTHNDVTVDGSNLFVPQDGDVVVFDWDGSTMSVPGADLGLLCELSSRERLLIAYVEKMAKLGFRLELDRVRMTANVLRGFRLLQSGWRSGRRIAIQRGLNLLARYTNN